VELVEEDAGDPVEGRVGEDHAREHALGDDLDARPAADLGPEPHAQAHGVADLLAERSGHAVGGGAGGEAARLEQDQLPPVRPGLAEERQRHPRRLAGAGRRHQHGADARGQRRRQVGQGVVDRQGRVEYAHGGGVAAPGCRRKRRAVSSRATCVRWP
jgi:hypothetical protein